MRRRRASGRRRCRGWTGRGRGQGAQGQGQGTGPRSPVVWAGSGSSGLRRAAAAAAVPCRRIAVPLRRALPGLLVCKGGKSGVRVRVRVRVSLSPLACQTRCPAVHAQVRVGSGRAPGSVRVVRPDQRAPGRLGSQPGFAVFAVNFAVAVSNCCQLLYCCICWGSPSGSEDSIVLRRPACPGPVRPGLWLQGPGLGPGSGEGRRGSGCCCQGHCLLACWLCQAGCRAPGCQDQAAVLAAICCIYLFIYLYLFEVQARGPSGLVQPGPWVRARSGQGAQLSVSVHHPSSVCLPAGPGCFALLVRPSGAVYCLTVCLVRPDRLPSTRQDTVPVHQAPGQEPGKGQEQGPPGCQEQVPCLSGSGACQARLAVRLGGPGHQGQSGQGVVRWATSSGSGFPGVGVGARCQGQLLRRLGPVRPGLVPSAGPRVRNQGTSSSVGLCRLSTRTVRTIVPSVPYRPPSRPAQDSCLSVYCLTVCLWGQVRVRSGSGQVRPGTRARPVSRVRSGCQALLQQTTGQARGGGPGPRVRGQLSSSIYPY